MHTRNRSNEDRLYCEYFEVVNIEYLLYLNNSRRKPCCISLILIHLTSIERLKGFGSLKETRDASEA